MDLTTLAMMGGNVAGAYIGAQSAKSINKKQIALSREQMDFQRDMSNTAYQRAMADMRAAGINPIMVSKVGGATTPTGAQPPSLKDPAQSAFQAVNSASVVRQNLANTRLLEQEANYYDQKGYPKSVGTQAPLNIFLSEYLHKHPKEKDALFKKITSMITSMDPMQVKLLPKLGNILQPSGEQEPFNWKQFLNNDMFRPLLSMLIMKMMSSMKTGSTGLGFNSLSKDLQKKLKPRR